MLLVTALSSLCRGAARNTLRQVLLKHFSEKLGRRGPLHDGYMRSFQEIFEASQARASHASSQMSTVKGVQFCICTPPI